MFLAFLGGGWVVCVVCVPPFLLTGGPKTEQTTNNERPGSRELTPRGISFGVCTTRGLFGPGLSPRGYYTHTCDLLRVFCTETSVHSSLSRRQLGFVFVQRIPTPRIIQPLDIYLTILRPLFENTQRYVCCCS